MLILSVDRLTAGPKEKQITSWILSQTNITFQVEKRRMDGSIRRFPQEVE